MIPSIFFGTGRSKFLFGLLDGMSQFFCLVGRIRVGWDEPVSCLVGWMRIVKLIWHVGPTCHVLIFSSKYNHVRSYFIDLIVTNIMI
uniref:Uncharacterized protein n=1 Tax=Arundo donax TaxID=35708 RepID=A0A0A9E5M7_ARUDO